MVRERRKVSRVTAELPCATRLGASGPRPLKGRSQTATPVLRSANARPAPRSLASGAGVTPGLIVLSARSCFTCLLLILGALFFRGSSKPVFDTLPVKARCLRYQTNGSKRLGTCDQKVLDEEITSRQNSCKKGAVRTAGRDEGRRTFLPVRYFSSDSALCWR